MNDREEGTFAVIAFKLSGSLTMTNSFIEVMLNLPSFETSDPLTNVVILFVEQKKAPTITNVTVSFRGIIRNSTCATPDGSCA